MKIVEFEQGSPEWHAWRAGRIGASDASIIAAYFMDDVCSWPYGAWPGLDLYKLWRLKVGKAQHKEGGGAMAHGRRMEQPAREWYMAQTGNVCAPVCVEHSKTAFAAASLDGMVDDKRIVEIKSPKESETWEIAQTNCVPSQYLAQVQHQLYASETAEVCDFVVFYRGEGCIVEVKRNERFIARLINAEATFWEWVQAGEFPLPQGEAGRDDNDWMAALDARAMAQAQVRFGEANLRRANGRIMQMMNAGKIHGCGYTVTLKLRNGYTEKTPRAVEETLSLTVDPD